MPTCTPTALSQNAARSDQLDATLLHKAMPTKRRVIGSITVIEKKNGSHIENIGYHGSTRKRPLAFIYSIFALDRPDRSLSNLSSLHAQSPLQQRPGSYRTVTGLGTRLKACSQLFANLFEAWVAHVASMHQ